MISVINITEIQGEVMLIMYLTQTRWWIKFNHKRALLTLEPYSSVAMIVGNS